MSRAAPGASATGALMAFMLLMLISGTLNTLLMKFMVMQRAPVGAGGTRQEFNHPYFQSLLMMIGEFLCLPVYLATRTANDAVKAPEEAPKHVFMVACLLDWTATTLVNMAYVVIPASVVQMTRGAIVIFTCIFSILFLGRRQHGYHIAGVSMVFVGITLVSLSALMSPAAPTPAGKEQQLAAGSRLMGIALCIGAQVFQASMLVYEERIMSRFCIPPLQVVGMEGMCGLGVGLLLLCSLNALSVESTPAALYQISHCPPLFAAVVGSICSIALFNYSGVTVTQQASAVARSTIDVSRTILIWLVELSLHWNSFSLLQLAGFAVLASGTLIYNRLLVIPALEPLQAAVPLAGSEKLNRAA